MKFKIGEIVNFLNESGGGKVIKILDSRLVLVETNEGFEMPVLASELIKDFRSAENQEDSFAVHRKPLISEPEVVVEEESSVSEINPWGKVREEKGIYLAFEPHEQQWVLTGEMDIILINNTSHDILYSMFMEVNGDMEGVDFSSVPPDSKIVISTIDRDELENWIKGYVEILFDNDLVEHLYYPLHS